MLHAAGESDESGVAALRSALDDRPAGITQSQQVGALVEALAGGIVEFIVHAPLIAKAARAGQFVRVLAWPNGELIPLTLADWDAKAGTICLVVQGMGTSSIEINRMQVGAAFAGIAGPLGQPS